MNARRLTDTGAAGVATVYDAPSALIQSLQEEWAKCTPDEARKKLRSPDVSVSNGKDKAMQLGKKGEDGKVEGCRIFELDDLAREEMASDSSPQGARYSTRESDEKLQRIRSAKQQVRLLAKARQTARISQSFVRRSRDTGEEH